jgi:hypothetical protein
MGTQQLSKSFVSALEELAEPLVVVPVSRFFHFEENDGTGILGVSIGSVFPDDRINNWDPVDRAAPHVIGGYLADEPEVSGISRLARPARGSAEPPSSVPSTSFDRATSVTRLLLPNYSSAIAIPWFTLHSR